MDELTEEAKQKKVKENRQRIVGRAILRLLKETDSNIHLRFERKEQP
jgi:hypothetical protein